jgi:hypothetical protein
VSGLFRVFRDGSTAAGTRTTRQHTIDISIVLGTTPWAVPVTLADFSGRMTLLWQSPNREYIDEYYSGIL